MLPLVIMRYIVLLTANQKWEISFKIIDSRNITVEIVDQEHGIVCPGRVMGSLSGILVVEPTHDPQGKTHFLAHRRPKLCGSSLGL